MMRQAGFTLVELIMVIVILGILALVAAPKLGDLTAYNLNSASHDLLTAIRHTQQQSMSHSGADHFRITIAGSGFTVTQNGNPVTNPQTGTSGYSQDTQAWSGISVTAGTGIISFDSRGKPTCSGGLGACSTPSDSPVTITLSTGADSITVQLEQYSGYARIN